ncbi:MAG: glycosyltransferase family 2 protein [Acidimicrobiales bacterium]
MPDLTLSIVMPVYNERSWVQRSIPAVLAQAAAADLASVEAIIVDDGSTDGTSEVLDELAEVHPIKVVHQPNGGRLAARHAGLELAGGDMVLFIDSRIIMRDGALKFACEQVAQGRRVWNAHVEIETGNPYAAFWDGIARVAWADYFSAPRTMSYGLDDFDRYPKGTTCFLAPRDLLVQGMSSFTTFYADVRNANDDTTVIRHIAANESIWLSPDFCVDYTGRDSAQKFMKHANARGTVFVDGHLRKGGRFTPVILSFFPASLAALVVVIRRPQLIPVGVLGIVASAAAMAKFKGLPGRLTRPVAMLAPAFAVAFGAGMWRGLLLAIQARACK